ncbi:hypothetical protein OSB04_009637 [Centaurea solstitialis]|uniref:F-box domain-containing protein n=1 Tax=Centaurea solstitialis TaxID=347529 RepID=A0AA38TQW2_9ASTR|nr:hypothetical protein OSB04_009637 [Centaurea solstitialis]
MANLEEITPPNLSPEIVLFHILPRLPSKSLLRSKCVCKQWRSFLTSPLFAKIHLHHVTAVDRHHDLKVLYLHVWPCAFRTIDCEARSVSKIRRYPFARCATVTTSTVNGLVCMGMQPCPGKWENTDEFSDMIIWNPLTGEYKTLSTPIDTKCYSNKALAFELYYTCSDDDYKILSITTDRNVYVYSLRSDSWRKLESTLDHEDRIPYYAAAGDRNLLDDEKLHFLWPLEINRRYVVGRLDLKTEKFTKIAVPPSCGYVRLRLTVVRRGWIELTIFDIAAPLTWTIQTWRMNGDGSDWTNMVNTSYYCALSSLRNGSLLVVNRNGICNVDVEKNTKDRNFQNPPHDLDSRMYIETFVSPNRFHLY